MIDPISGFGTIAATSATSVGMRLVLNNLLGLATGDLSAIESKLDELIRAPLESANRSIRLADRYPDNSKAQIDEYNSARVNYERAASQISGLAAVKCLLAAASCSRCLGDEVAYSHFIREAHKSFIVNRDVAFEAIHRKSPIKTVARKMTNTFGFFNPGASGSILDFATEAFVVTASATLNTSELDAFNDFGAKVFGERPLKIEFRL